MSPTVFRDGPFSREEERPHIHVESSGGEAKLWLEPNVDLPVDSLEHPERYPLKAKP